MSDTAGRLRARQPIRAVVTPDETVPGRDAIRLSATPVFSWVTIAEMRRVVSALAVVAALAACTGDAAPAADAQRSESPAGTAHRLPWRPSPSYRRAPLRHRPTSTSCRLGSSAQLNWACPTRGRSVTSTRWFPRTSASLRTPIPSSVFSTALRESPAKARIARGSPGGSRRPRNRSTTGCSQSN